MSKSTASRLSKSPGWDAPVGLPVHPLKEMREDAHLTMEQLAHFADCSKQYIVRAEQGVYAKPPTDLIECLLELGNVDEDVPTVELAYTTWQQLRREASYGALNPEFDWHIDDSPKGGMAHPFVHWRMHSGLRARISVSKLYCVHPALMFKFEEQPWLCTNPPNELMDALRVAGYSSYCLGRLERSYQLFRKLRRVH